MNVLLIQYWIILNKTACKINIENIYTLYMHMHYMYYTCCVEWVRLKSTYE